MCVYKSGDLVEGIDEVVRQLTGGGFPDEDKHPHPAFQYCLAFDRDVPYAFVVGENKPSSGSDLRNPLLILGGACEVGIVGFDVNARFTQDLGEDLRAQIAVSEKYHRLRGAFVQESGFYFALFQSIVQRDIRQGLSQVHPLGNHCG